MKWMPEFRSMHVLVTAATELEIKPFRRSGIPADILVTGVGVPETMYKLQKRLNKKTYDLVIQAGVAGAFNKQFKLADVVLIKEDCFADIGISEQGEFTPIFETALADKNSFPYKKGWLVNHQLAKYKTLLPLARSITINTVSGSKKQKDMLLKKFNPQLETMEGAAFHLICLHEKIPFMQIRSISNYVGERDKNKWKIKEAVQNLSQELIRIVTLINQQEIKNKLHT